VDIFRDEKSNFRSPTFSKQKELIACLEARARVGEAIEEFMAA
jgi:hypothetical protein